VLTAKWAMSIAAVVEPEVTFHTLGMTSPGRPVITIPLPLSNSRGVTFTLKEGSLYRLKFTFTVSHNIVSGLKYVHTVWKGGLQGTSSTSSFVFHQWSDASLFDRA
jgi:Rho GDP-dissociation inhibitor